MTEVNVPRPARAMRADARRNHERLLREAALVIAERGEHASLDEIAKRAGVGSGTLYRHFPSRHDLLEAVHEGSVEEVACRARELAEAEPPGVALQEWMLTFARQMAGVKGLRALLGSAAAGPATPDGSLCAGRIREAARELLTAAQSSGEVRGDLDAADLLRLVHAVTSAAELAGPGASDETTGRYLALLVEGIRVRQPDAPVEPHKPREVAGS
ncbi:TetR/AcrR family transcriptional regulator [Streptomyces sp. NA04227]|uniref:TetR/AcrR family transcriptional regulator n=1 Tax=Streptomyces sp. NA04227 TaxID=2742136 RepID=UPI0015911EA5|nr:TetR/AcrR family transcriptional regulator [Streptomyces sp. NA04227]QKW05814.1 TetR/AcrR family transcriptional regulator [Streptomyces sp. NA04227]